MTQRADSVRAGTVIFAMSIVIWALSYFPRPASIQEQADAKAAALVETESKKGPVSEERKTEIQTATQFEADSLYLGQSYLGRAWEIDLSLYLRLLALTGRLLLACWPLFLRAK